jgi:methylated-DNA-protein-cysteine methyltransferase related protein
MNSKDVIFEIVAQIPEGKVATYGQIAKLAGIKSARIVGNALHTNDDPVRIPCHRVVNRVGRLAPAYAFGGPDEQAARLRKEGVEVQKNHVDLAVYQWDGN